MQCRMCKNCDWNAQHCYVWGVGLQAIASNPDYNNIVIRCYEPLISPQMQQPPPRPRPVQQAVPQSQAPQMPPQPSFDDVRMASMFATGEDMATGKKQKKGGLRGPVNISGVVGMLVNIIVWATLAGTTLLFFAIAGYSMAVPQLVIRQGDIPTAAVAVLAIGTIIALVKGVSIIRGVRNAA